MPVQQKIGYNRLFEPIADIKWTEKHFKDIARTIRFENNRCPKQMQKFTSI